jgi:hypothetical protein
MLFLIYFSHPEPPGWEEANMADIRVNDRQWDAAGEAERNRIEKALRDNGALADGDRIVGSSDVPPFTADTELDPLWNPIKDICKAGCDVAAAAARGWCMVNTTGPALVACLGAVEAVRRECRRRC